MEVKRNKMNEYIIQQFKDGDLPGYKSSLNGEFVWSLENDGLYGPCLKLRNYMGYEIIHTNNKSAEELSNKVQEVYSNLDKIIEQEKSFNDYCSKNPWTYSGT